MDFKTADNGVSSRETPEERRWDGWCFEDFLFRASSIGLDFFDRLDETAIAGVGGQGSVKWWEMRAAKV